MTEDSKLNISKEEIFAGKIKDETVSEMAKMTAKQIYWQGFNAALVLIGISMIVAAVVGYPKSSYEDGSFLLVIIAFIGGLICVLAGVVLSFIAFAWGA